jgi:hypothetical protein
MPSPLAPRLKVVPALVGAVAIIVGACGSAAPATPSASQAAVASAPSRSFAPIANPAPATPRPSAGPSASPSPAPSARATSGVAALPRHGKITLTDAGYAITLPSNWYRIDLTEADLESFFKAGAGNLGSGVTNQLMSQVAQLAAQRISLFALRFPDAKAGAGTNLNVAVFPTLGLDLDALEKLNVAQLSAALKGVKITHQHETLPAGEAVRFAYTLELPSQPGTTAALIQHLLVSGDKQIMVSCTAPGSITKIAGECDAIAKSVDPLG